MSRALRRIEKHDRIEALTNDQLRRAVRGGILDELFTGALNWTEFILPAEQQRAREILAKRGQAL